MAWNQKAKLFAMAVAVQPVAGVFTAPATPAGLIAVSSPTFTIEALSATDETSTGAIWDNNRVFLGQTVTAGGTVPLRGPGGAAPPAANVWPVGLVLQSGGWAETVRATATPAVLQAGSTTTALVLATSESAVDDFLVGAPITQANIGTGFKATSIIRDYVGSSRTALLAETLGTAPTTGAAYTIPASLSYVLGTLTVDPPTLSVRIWRDKKRYDIKDWKPQSLTFDIPVANEANQSYPTLEFTGKGNIEAIADDTTPTLPSSMLAIPAPPARDGKFYLDSVRLGHQSIRYTESAETGAASNQNSATGQDAYDILSGSRTIDLDLNQMAVTDFDYAPRVTNQTIMPMLSTWGLGAGNRFGFMVPNTVLDPLSPGERNGYVSLTGNAFPTDVDKSAAFVIWW